MEQSPGAEKVRLFAYGLLLAGEREHDLLAGAALLGPASTLPIYTLVDLGVYPALLSGGTVSVKGELYEIDKKTRFALDVLRQCPALFHRISVRLEGGRDAEAYAMNDEQVRGKRRLKHGSWRDRFLPKPLSAPGPMAEYARKRWT